MNISTHLPPPPTGVGNYVIGYLPNEDTYRLGVTEYTGDIILNDEHSLTTNGVDRVIFGDRYELINNEWVYYTSSAGWTSWYSDSSSLGNTEYGKLVTYSSNKIISSTGSILSLGGDEKTIDENGITVIGTTLSSGTIKTTLLSSVRDVLLISVLLIIGVIAFRKAWQFLRSQIQGA